MLTCKKPSAFRFGARSTRKAKKPGPIPTGAINLIAECRFRVWLDTEHAAGKIFLVTREDLPAAP